MYITKDFRFNSNSSSLIRTINFKNSKKETLFTFEFNTEKGIPIMPVELRTETNYLTSEPETIKKVLIILKRWFTSHFTINGTKPTEELLFINNTLDTL